MGSAIVPNNPDDKIESRITTALHKYVAIWVWSVLFGGQTGVLFQISNYRGFEYRGAAALIVAPLVAIAGFFSILAYHSLWRFLDEFIIPVFFKQSADPEITAKASRYLKRSVLYFIASIGILIFLAVTGLLLSSVRFWDKP